VIPLEYRLREPVRLQAAKDGTWRVICEEPLTVLTVNAAAARLLKGTRYGATIADLATGLGLSDERVLTLCEYFRGRGIVDVRRAPSTAGPRIYGGSGSGPATVPSVTVIIPTLDRADDLDHCLDAVAALDYPAERLDVIIVDDASADAKAIADVAERHGARLLVNDKNRGPAHARNRAAAEAEGDILAFVDSDCVLTRSWLRDLTPYFAWDKVGAVGGRTLGYYAESLLDRYEEVASPLDMGRHLRILANGSDSFYVPTCNLLVRRSIFEGLGGLRADLRVGEDVDFCWRLRAAGQYLVYAPEGIVHHKHRDRLQTMLRRRAQYGTSEALLHGLHPDKRKRFPFSPAPLATVALVSAALVKREPRLLPLCLAPALWEGWRRRERLREAGVGVSDASIWNSAARSHLSMLYFAYFHLTRYYLGPLTALGLLARGFWWLEAAAVLYSSGVDYFTKRPRLPLPVYGALYLAEHAAYQTGVVRGCVRARSFRTYLPVFERRKAPGANIGA
jgi:mycofactocin system glycosyltransferase